MTNPNKSKSNDTTEPKVQSQGKYASSTTQTDGISSGKQSYINLPKGGGALGLK